jgi:hypothetical protein
MLRQALLAMTSLGAALFGGGVANACGTGDVSVSFSSVTTPSPAWNPLPGGAASTATFSVTVTRTSSGNVDSARLVLRDANTGSPLRLGSSGPIYNIGLSSSPATAVVFPSGALATSASNYLSFALPNSNSSVKQDLTVTIPFNTAGEDFVGGAVFTEQLTYSIQCYKSNGQTTGGGLTGNAASPTLTIPKVLSVITAGPQTIDFGTFTQTQQTLNISLRSTSSVNAGISTSNGNVMVRQGAVTPYPANESIPYSMAFNGVSVPAAGLSGQNYSRATVGGAAWPLILNLPSLPSGKLAGLYQDVITLTLTAGN